METIEAELTKKKSIGDSNTENKKKILMLIPNLDFGGAQKVFYELSLALSENHEIIECVFNVDHGHAYPSGNPVISLDIPSGKNFVDKAYRFLQRCWKLRQVKRKENVDITISHLEGANYVNILSGSKGKKILVVHGSKTAPDSNYVGILDWLQRKLFIPCLFRFADRIVVVSRAIKHELIEYYGITEKNIKVINNSFNLSKITTLAEEPLPAEFQAIFSKPTIITSGRLAEQKNPFALLDTFNLVRKELECHLVFIGDGHLKEQLMSKAISYDLKVCDASIVDAKISPDYDVYFPGFQENPFKFINKADLFVLTSDFEGFPLALCEAMISGTLVLSTDCPTGPREILAPDTPLQQHAKQPEETAYGWLMPLVREGDPEVLQVWVEVISSCLRNPDFQKIEAARERMTAFDYKHVFQQWENLIGD